MRTIATFIILALYLVVAYLSAGTWFASGFNQRDPMLMAVGAAVAAVLCALVAAGVRGIWRPVRNDRHAS